MGFCEGPLLHSGDTNLPVALHHLQWGVKSGQFNAGVSLGQHSRRLTLLLIGLALNLGAAAMASSSSCCWLFTLQGADQSSLCRHCQLAKGAQ